STYADGNGALVSQTGGLLGSAKRTDIANCASSAEVLSQNGQTGGLIGAMFAGTMTECCATGNVTAARTDEPAIRVGGLLGLAADTLASTDRPQLSIRVKDCYATGDVTGGIRTGGLIGWVERCAADADIHSEVTNCYASGAVEGFDMVGGLFGFVGNYEFSALRYADFTDEKLESSYDIRHCFAINPSVSMKTEGLSYTDSFLGALGGRFSGPVVGYVDSEEMTIDAAALEPGSTSATSWKTYEDAGWSSDVWSIQEPGTYPVLVPGEAGEFSVRLEADKIALTEGETIGLNAVVENGTGDYTYKFIVYNQTTNQWYRIQNFSDQDTCSWYSGPAGEKMLYVDVKAEDGTVTRAGLPVTVTARTPFVLSSSNGTVLSQKSHTMLTVSGDDLENYTYKFIVYNKTTQQWYKLRDFGASAEYDWYTGPVGEKVLYADRKDANGQVQRIALDVTVS
ncbi:MAG: hypothetical protein IKX83_05235, partial [Clostridia bacterium]|nr:hypothetical protein [Clostridia bacterium]